MVVSAEEVIEQEQLPYSVGDVNNLNDKVYNCQVAAVHRPSDALTASGVLTFAAESGEELAEALGHVLQRFLVTVVPVSLAFDRGVRDDVDGNSRLLVEHAPDGARQIEEESLEAEDQRYPLVIADLCPILAILLR